MSRTTVAELQVQTAKIAETAWLAQLQTDAPHAYRADGVASSSDRHLLRSDLLVCAATLAGSAARKPR